MHELMVHVEQVLVHEGVVAGHLAVQPPRLVLFALGKPERLRYSAFRQRRVARKDEYQAVNLARRIRLHPVRQALLAQIRNIHALAGLVIGPPVVMAFQLIPVDHPQVQRNLAMGAAVLEREHLPGLPPVQNYWLTGEPARKRLALLQLITPGNGVPVIGMRTHATKVECVRRIRGTHRNQIRAFFLHRGSRRHSRRSA